MLVAFSIAPSSEEPDGGVSEAVARAVGTNQIAIVIPCHRVIGADGTLTGYAGGLWRKQALIGIERKLAQAGHDSAG